MYRRNNISRKDGGETDMIAFDNPDDALEDLPKQMEGDGDTLVVVDNPDDFEDEGDV